MGDVQSVIARIMAEDRIGVAEAARLVGTDSEPTHASTITRFITRGARTRDGRRVKLEAFRIGARWVTSREAVARFLADLTAEPGESGRREAREDRRRAADRAAAQLEALGA